MGSEVEVLEELSVDSTFHHQDHRIMAIAFDDDLDRFALFELLVDGCDL